jgi:hypothetical protein
MGAFRVAAWACGTPSVSSSAFFLSNSGVRKKRRTAAPPKLRNTYTSKTLFDFPLNEIGAPFLYPGIYIGPPNSIAVTVYRPVGNSKSIIWQVDGFVIGYGNIIRSRINIVHHRFDIAFACGSRTMVRVRK